MNSEACFLFMAAVNSRADQSRVKPNDRHRRDGIAYRQAGIGVLDSEKARSIVPRLCKRMSLVVVQTR